MMNTAPKQFIQLPKSSIFHPASSPAPLGQLSQHINNKSILSYYQNYHTFTNRPTHQPHIQLSKFNKFMDQRAASADGGRSIFTNIFSPEQLTASPTTPYIFNNKQKIKFQKLPKKNPIKAISQQHIEQMGKSSPKLSMKNIYINRNSEKQSLFVDGKQSLSTAVIQTVRNQSDILWNKKKIEGCQKILDLELVKSDKTDRLLEGLKEKIEEQTKIIQTLKKRIFQQETRIEQKQNQIKVLIKNYEDQNSQKIRIRNKIYKIQKFLSEIIAGTLRKGESIQESINLKIEQIKQHFLGSLGSLAQIKNPQYDANKTMYDFIKAFENLKKARQVLFSKYHEEKTLFKSQLLSLKIIAQKIKENGYRIKQYLNQNMNQMSETGKFYQSPSNLYFSNVSQDFQQKNKQILDESSSYFFYPSQLENLEKIKELFFKRNNQPIHCYINAQNQLKYKQTNTYIFNMRGEIIVLTDFEKKYYIENGFITIYKMTDI